MPEVSKMDASRTRNILIDLSRVGFAACVILSHSFELVDGTRVREPLTRLFGALSFGELAVNAFFAISGYLVVQSYGRSANVWQFLKRRDCEYTRDL